MGIIIDIIIIIIIVVIVIVIDVNHFILLRLDDGLYITARTNHSVVVVIFLSFLLFDLLSLHTHNRRGQHGVMSTTTDFLFLPTQSKEK